MAAFQLFSLHMLMSSCRAALPRSRGCRRNRVTKPNSAVPLVGVQSKFRPWRRSQLQLVGTRARLEACGVIAAGQSLRFA